MSAIGPGSIGTLHIAGSFAGAQRTESDADRNKLEAADRKARADRAEVAAQVLDDVGETDLTPERDADGRLPYAAYSQAQVSADDEESSADPSAGPPDAFGERGNVLDLQA